tara:strand:+ start:1831 stop:2556 length:726 start_codon:yes stop_codon:yes gene_type:complete
MSKKYVNEIPKLPDDHHLAVTHECYNYPSWLDYLDSKSNYHFDKWRDDSNYPGIDDKLKFRWKTDITKEIFPFVREKSRNMHPNDIGVLYGAWWLHEQEVRGMDHVGFKEVVKPEKHPTLCKIVDWFEWADEPQPIIMEKNVGNFETYHVDTMDGHPSGYGVKELARIIIHLQDWEPGQLLQWGNRVITQWKAGDTIAYDKNVPHGTANCSRYRRYSLRITGAPSKHTLEKIQQGGVINID